MKLSDVLREDDIFFIETNDIESSLELLSEKAYEKNHIKNRVEFYEALIEREEIVSTGIGVGIAIPHVKLKSIEEFFIIIAISKTGIDWDSIDRKPVKAIFLIGGPENKQKTYLKIISKIMLLVKNSNRRERLFNSKDKKEIVELFKNF